MVTISFSSNDPVNDKQDLDDFVYKRGYQDFVNGIPNPQTKIQFAKQELLDFYKSNIIQSRADRVSTTVNVQ